MKLPMVRVALRSFFIQCCWNFERMQNVGFAFAMAPALKRIYPDKQRRLQALKRHMEFFNTHPYMASLVMGSALKLEEDSFAAGLDPTAGITALKSGLMGPLAAMGDSLFWATLRPMVALLGVAAAWMCPELPPIAILAGYLMLVNLPHLALRLSALWQGHLLGFEVVGFLRKIDTQGLIASLRLAAMVLLGATLSFFGRLSHPASGSPMPFRDDLLFVGAGLAMLMALRLRISVTKILLGCCLGALVFSAAQGSH
jgi:PTS system mannose-specific IID component